MSASQAVPYGWQVSLANPWPSEFNARANKVLGIGTEDPPFAGINVDLVLARREELQIPVCHDATVDIVLPTIGCVWVNGLLIFAYTRSSICHNVRSDPEIQIDETRGLSASFNLPYSIFRPDGRNVVAIAAFSEPFRGAGRTGVDIAVEFRPSTQPSAACMARRMPPRLSVAVHEQQAHFRQLGDRTDAAEFLTAESTALSSMQLPFNSDVANDRAVLARFEVPQIPYPSCSSIKLIIHARSNIAVWLEGNLVFW